MVTLYTLSAEEFPMLASISDGVVPDPKSSRAILANDENGIAGRVFLMSPTHVEGPWVRGDLRGSTLAARLMFRAEQEAKDCGITRLFAYAASDELADYLSRLGYKKEPYTVWSKGL